ncbi:MAG: hypothetical protein U5J83_02095 [Bryobacterales bacterium]|nr:hypothetical protein [Bryobacterales bacterium]
MRDPHSVENVTGVAVAAYALLLASSHNLDPSRDFTLPNPGWNRRHHSRATTRQLIQQLRQDLLGASPAFLRLRLRQDSTTKCRKLNR